MGCGASAKKEKYSPDDPQAGAAQAGSAQAGRADGAASASTSSVIKKAPEFSKRLIRDVYQIEDRKVLAKGSLGTVRMAQDIQSGTKRACKVFNKEQAQAAKIDPKQELRFLQSLDHPNIVKLIVAYEDPMAYYAIFEALTGGAILDFIVEYGGISEPQGAGMVKQVVLGVSYLHARGVCHRGIMPENIFCNSDNKDSPVVKIINFRAACECVKGQKMKEQFGTSFYVSPQVFDGDYTNLCDVWACGVVMYLVLCGYPPFVGRTAKEIKQRVHQGEFEFDEEAWKSISKDAKDLLKKLLAQEEANRPEASEALQHTWLQKQAPNAAPDRLQVGKLKDFCNSNALKKTACGVIAKRLKATEIAHLRESFVALDKNGDGVVTMQELREGITKLGMSCPPKDLVDICEHMDTNGSKEIDYSEFIAAMLTQKQIEQEQACQEAFRLFDADASGKISRKELHKVLNNNELQEAIGADAIKQVMKDSDKDGDGEIDFKEFMALMRNQNK